MSRIYKNSLLTVAAAEPAGCFRSRRRKQARPLYFDITVSSDNRSSDGLGWYIFADRRTSKDGFRPRSTLDTRAWVLQEQLLSPRTLYYADQELYWDCSALSASESFPAGIPGFYDPKLKAMRIMNFRSICFGNQDGTAVPDLPVSEDHLASIWRKVVVEEYSSRSLTYRKDKLVALLGITKEMTAVMGASCFTYGLWRKTLWRDLLWWVKDPEASSALDDVVDSDSSPGVPSWSWAAIDSAVTFDLAGNDNEADLVQCVDVVDVDGSRIVLRGKLMPLLSSPVEQIPSAEPFPQWHEDAHGVDAGSACGLVIAVSKSNMYGLALQRVVAGEGDGISLNYKRVGQLCWRESPVKYRWDAERKSWADDDAHIKCISLI